MTTTAQTNGYNPYTGTVHAARQDGRHLVQECGVYGNAFAGQRSSLIATTDAVTCKRCEKATARKARPVAAKRVPAAKPAAKKSSGSATWGVFTVNGNLRAWRGTRGAAQAIAQDGETVQKI